MSAPPFDRRVDAIVRERAEHAEKSTACSCYDESCWACVAFREATLQATTEAEREACARLVVSTRRALEAKAKASGGASPETIELFNVLDAIAKRIRLRGTRRK